METVNVYIHIIWTFNTFRIDVSCPNCHCEPWTKLASIYVGRNNGCWRKIFASNENVKAAWQSGVSNDVNLTMSTQLASWAACRACMRRRGHPAGTWRKFLAVWLQARTAWLWVRQEWDMFPLRLQALSTSKTVTNRRSILIDPS